MSLVDYFSQPVWHRLGLTLVHFLWQGLMVAVITSVAVRFLALNRANLRYAAYLLAFTIMAACPAITLMALSRSTQQMSTAAGRMQESDSVPPSLRPIPLEVSSRTGPRLGSSPTTSDTLARMTLQTTMQASLPWVLVCWMIGVLILSVRLLFGLIGVWRWRRKLEPLTQGLTERVAWLSERLGMAGFSRVFVSRRAVEVVAIGYMRPMVLLPAAVVTQMPPEMLEAVIAHELAHIRRFDLWVNLAQRVVEILLFYHPVVWWLSNRVRSERELCCDELAVSATGERLTYARALESAGRIRLAMGRPALALGFRNGSRSTLSRVRHILGLAPMPPDSRLWLAGAVTVVLLAILAMPTALVLTARGQAQPAAQKADKSTQSTPANAAGTERPARRRYAGQMFNSKMALSVWVVREVGDVPRSIGQMPSASPIWIPACCSWLVQPTVPVEDWDLLITEMSRSGIPGLKLEPATDSDLRHIAGLGGLQFLDLSGTSVTDAGLAQLEGLTKLEWLDLTGTPVTDAGLAHLKGLTGLQELNLHRTRITGPGLAHLKDMTRLRNLRLDTTDLADAGLEHLKGLKGLEQLKLGYTLITDAGMAHLKGLTGLRELYLPYTRITDAGLAHLKGLTGLKMLSLGYTYITDAGLVHLKDLTGLTWLNLANARIRGAGLEHLRGLPELISLDLSDTLIMDAGLEHLKGLTGLQVVWLDSTWVTDEGRAQLRQSMPKLSIGETAK